MFPCICTLSYTMLVSHRVGGAAGTSARNVLKQLATIRDRVKLLHGMIACIGEEMVGASEALGAVPSVPLIQQVSLLRHAARLCTKLDPFLQLDWVMSGRCTSFSAECSSSPLVQSGCAAGERLRSYLYLLVCVPACALRRSLVPCLLGACIPASFALY